MNCNQGVSGTVYDYKAKTLDGEDIQFSKYSGKNILFVNVATYCDYTAQYPGKNSGLNFLETGFVRQPESNSRRFC